MAVPKKRTGASAQGHRRSNWKATVPETTVCPNCGELVLTVAVLSILFTAPFGALGIDALHKRLLKTL